MEREPSKPTAKNSFAKIVLSIIVGILLFVLLIPSILNHRNGQYENLNSTDQVILKELDMYLSQEAATPVWNSYNLYHRTILAINKEAGHAFLVNPTVKVNSLFAKEIKMPDDYSIRVYRVSTSAPQMLPFKFGGDFNIIDKEYRLFGNSVYFTKYDSNSVEIGYSSNHYITFLTHEAFHYFMQGNWTVSGRFDTSVLTEKDLDLMAEEYEVLEKIYKALEKRSHDELLSLTSDYVTSVQQRIEQNPEYMQEELQAETNDK